eukprot:1157257-Pelagomonas_calceolata.AAC.9
MSTSTLRLSFGPNKTSTHPIKLQTADNHTEAKDVLRLADSHTADSHTGTKGVLRLAVRKQAHLKEGDQQYE